MVRDLGRPTKTEMRILSINVGRIAPFARDGRASAFVKRTVPSANVHALGVEGDEHGDPAKHGGAEKAVHQYPYEHYLAWRELGLAGHLLETYGAFGENLTTEGMTEASVCVGDVYAAGPAGLIIQVSQTRQPCWKLGAYFGLKSLPRDIQHGGRTGWHYRVLTPGPLNSGERLTLLDRPHPAWPLARLTRMLYIDTLDHAALAELAELPALAESLRSVARRRLASGTVEEWVPRLEGTLT